jgi:hypothetical protein
MEKTGQRQQTHSPRGMAGLSTEEGRVQAFLPSDWKCKVRNAARNGCFFAYDLASSLTGGSETFLEQFVNDL